MPDDFQYSITDAQGKCMMQVLYTFQPSGMLNICQ